MIEYWMANWRYERSKMSMAEKIEGIVQGIFFAIICSLLIILGD